MKRFEIDLRKRALNAMIGCIMLEFLRAPPRPGPDGAEVWPAPLSGNGWGSPPPGLRLSTPGPKRDPPGGRGLSAARRPAAG